MPEREGAKDTARRRHVKGDGAGNRKRQPGTGYRWPSRAPPEFEAGVARLRRRWCTFSPVTDAELARARTDPAFRQKLLTRSLELLLTGLQRLHLAQRLDGSGRRQEMREGVELAVRLAELIQNAAATAR